MQIEITPEPLPAEREVVERALAEAREEPLKGRSAWWRAGAVEAVSPEEEPA